MRTTVELPPELMRQAKARAASQGESLKTLLTRAVASELGRSTSSLKPSGHVRVPLFGNPKGKPVLITGEDLARALAEDDASRSERPKRPHQR